MEEFGLRSRPSSAAYILRVVTTGSEDSWELDLDAHRPIGLPQRNAAGPPLLPLVDGQAGDGAGALLACVSPATGEPFAQVACADRREIERAVESAAFAARLWRGAPFEERTRALSRLADRLLDESESIAGLIALEQGKPFIEALTAEVLPALDHLRFLARHAQELQGGEAVEPRHPFWRHKREHYLYDPLGVVALVATSSLPVAQPLIQAASALVMGNAVVLKPSEHTPMCGLRVGQLCLDAGFPAGLVNVVPATYEDTSFLVSHPRVDKVFVTGTVEAGRVMMRACGFAPRPIVLALGGSHPAIVAADADVDRAARGIAWGALANAGQNCGSVRRVFVEERIAATFVARLLDVVDRVAVGDPLEPLTEMGPLLHARRREEVHERVVEAVNDGARLLRGGEIPSIEGFYYPPTVLLDPPFDARLLSKETLGPVVAVVVTDNLERALMHANESDFALTASGWTTSEETAGRLMEGLQAGVVTINDCLYSYGEPSASWSGFRQSGLGSVHGRSGLKEMCRRRFVSYDAEPCESPLFAFPYDSVATAIARAALDALHATRRWKRAWGSTKLLLQRRFRARVPWSSYLMGRKRS